MKFYALSSETCPISIKHFSLPTSRFPVLPTSRVRMEYTGQAIASQHFLTLYTYASSTASYRMLPGHKRRSLSMEIGSFFLLARGMDEELHYAYISRLKGAPSTTIGK